MAQGFKTYTAVVGVAGTATVSIVTKSSESWVVHQVSVEMTGSAAAAAACAIRKNGYMISPVVPFADAAAGDPPVELLPTDTMTVEWTGCTAGAVARVSILFDRRSLGR